MKGARAHNVATACAAAAEAAAVAASGARPSSSPAMTASPLIYCVSPEWLQACLFGWERKDEALYPIAAAGVAGSGMGGRNVVARTDAEDLAAAAAAAGRAGGAGAG